MKPLRLGLLWTLFILSMTATADNVQPAAVAPVGAATLLSVLLGLLAIVGLILALAWFAKKVGAVGWTRHSDMKIVSSLALGTRERLLVVDVAGTQVLLGVTAHSVNQLHVFDTPVIDKESPPSEFNEKLISFMKPKQSQRSAGSRHDD